MGRLGSLTGSAARVGVPCRENANRPVAGSCVDGAFDMRVDPQNRPCYMTHSFRGGLYSADRRGEAIRRDHAGWGNLSTLLLMPIPSGARSRSVPSPKGEIRCAE